MVTSLDAIPRDILQHVAFLLATVSATEPPRHLIPLLLTNSKIYRSLDVRGCPHLYAHIFRATFDYDHALHSRLTDSALAAELQLRHGILWRTGRQNQSSDPTMEELWAALRMVLENAGHNERLFAAAGFTTFIMTYVQHHSGHAAAAEISSSSDSGAAMTMMMWLLCLTLTHQDIVAVPETARNQLRKALRFPACASLTCATYSDTDETKKPTSLRCTPHADHIVLLERASPAIILTFALNEAVPITIPPHLPKTRAIALATQRSGPTAEDFHVLLETRTPLFADLRRAWISGKDNVTCEEKYKSRIGPMMYFNYVAPSLAAGHVCLPGSLAGLWEGSFMMSGLPKPADPSSPLILGEFQCLKPMQCAITEYLCFSPHLPLPSDYPINQLEAAVKSGSFGYEKYGPSSNGVSCTERDSTEALDIIILGKTLHDHEQAWNGFRFAGRVCSDGCILMYREPKNRTDRGLGTWIFEGYLRYNAAFVGQWRSSIPTASCDLRGIFSLRKTDATWYE
ncbi:hypothetical protein LshimejAT787_1701550 [Lyophyllum shimeji]|uniref:Uncharacterized protein n=1 Tax=Lyophyllum shimeji TaxID=47721 RepID=A0A9P3UTD9_LYOSH|nr:hypothetical protein LshimejAT787_1701550 [Lyophyllum shimeji]